MGDPNQTDVDSLSTPQLRDLSAQCSSVVHELCDIVSNDPQLAGVIGELMTEDDILARINRLREADPDLAKRLVTATFGIAINTLHMVGLQQLLDQRTTESN